MLDLSSKMDNKYTTILEEINTFFFKFIYLFIY